MRRPRLLPDLLIAVVTLLVAVLLVTQFRTERSIRRTLGVTTPQLEELGYRLRRAESIRRALEQQVVTLREQVAAMGRAAGREEAGLRALSEEMERLRAFAGFTPVAGPGVVVEVRDSSRDLAPGQDPNDVLVHYTDLQTLVNELWAAGAEAMAINGERFTVTSSIQCVGTTVLVNKRRITAPFRIAAIGDAQALEAYLTRQGGVVGLLQAFGFPVVVSRSRHIALPPYRGTFPLASSRIAPANSSP